jgi:hypothetical protein
MQLYLPSVLAHRQTTEKMSLELINILNQLLTDSVDEHYHNLEIELQKISDGNLYQWLYVKSR